MAGQVCRWGILGTALIAQKNWKAIRNAEEATLVAIASRDERRAREFIDRYQHEAPFVPPPRAAGGYETLLASDDVDAVYIPLPTGMRKEWVIRAAEAGKHVLAEKPAAPHASDLEEMLAACRRNNVQYMDGVMFMHSRRLDAMRKVLDDGESVGDIRRINCQFSFCAPEEFLSDNIRVNSELEPLGCLGDLGWYTIRFILWVMKYELPHRVCGRLLSQFGRSDSPNPVPVQFSAELFYPDGLSASFYCSFVTEHQQWANVSGSKGFLHVDDFVLPYFGCELDFRTTNAVFNIRGCDFNMENYTRRHGVPEYGNSDPNAQESWRSPARPTRVGARLP